MFVYWKFTVLLYALFLSQYTQYFLGGLRHSQCSNQQCSHELQSCISSSDQPLNSIVTGATGYQASLLRYFVAVQSPCHVPRFAVLCTPNLNMFKIEIIFTFKSVPFHFPLLSHPPNFPGQKSGIIFYFFFCLLLILLNRSKLISIASQLFLSQLLQSLVELVPSANSPSCIQSLLHQIILTLLQEVMF